MFSVKGMKQGVSTLSGKEAECFIVECEKGTFRGLLTPREFKAQVRLRQNGNGDDTPLFGQATEQK